MRIFNYIHDHAHDLEFYGVNAAAVVTSIFSPYLEGVKEVLGIVVLVSIIVYNYFRIQSERKKGGNNKPPAGSS